MKVSNHNWCGECILCQRVFFHRHAWALQNPYIIQLLETHYLQKQIHKEGYCDREDSRLVTHYVLHFIDTPKHALVLKTIIAHLPSLCTCALCSAQSNISLTGSFSSIDTSCLQVIQAVKSSCIHCKKKLITIKIFNLEKEKDIACLSLSTTFWADKHAQPRKRKHAHACACTHKNIPPLPPHVHRVPTLKNMQPNSWQALLTPMIKQLSKWNHFRMS